MPVFQVESTAKLIMLYEAETPREALQQWAEHLANINRGEFLGETENVPNWCGFDVAPDWTSVTDPEDDLVPQNAVVKVGREGTTVLRMTRSEYAEQGE